MKKKSLLKNVPIEVQLRVDSDEYSIKKEITTKKFGLLEDNREIDDKSAAQKIYLGRRLKQKEFSALLAGDVSVIDDINKERIEIGDKFIAACHEISEGDEKKMQFFAKRYFIEGFDDFSKGKSYDSIFEIMKKLKYEDLKDVKSKDDFILKLTMSCK